MKKYFIFFTTVLTFLMVTGAGCLQFGPTTVQGPMGTFQSIDKGETWKQIVAYPTASGVKSIAGVKVYRMHTDPSDPNAIYLTTRGQGLFYTYDNGQTWQFSAPMAGKFIYGLAVDPKDKCTVYASDGQHIFKTEDCLRSWQLVYTEERVGQHFVALAVDYGKSNIIYGAEIGGDVLISNDSGKSWRAIHRLGFQLQHLVADSFKPGRIYVASYENGLHRSDDSGANWIDLSAGINNFSDADQFYRLVMNYGKKDSLFWLSTYGILRSDDAGVTWTDLKLITPPGSVNIYGFDISAKNQNEMYYTGTILGEKSEHVRSTFYKTTDGGKNWITKKLPTNTIPVGILINPKDSNILTMSFTVLD